jgi:N-acetylmuramic acid 6-phosphate (MurNAc-6-P) etherase
MLKTRSDARQARRRLAAAEGNIRRALKSDRGGDGRAKFKGN